MYTGILPSVDIGINNTGVFNEQYNMIHFDKNENVLLNVSLLHLYFSPDEVY